MNLGKDITKFLSEIFDKEKQMKQKELIKQKQIKTLEEEIKHKILIKEQDNKIKELKEQKEKLNNE